MKKIPVADRLDIQELVARYAFRCDTKQYGHLGELFAEDGIFDETVIGLPLCTDRKAIDGFFRSIGDADAIAFCIHLSSNHQIIHYDGTSASGTCHLHVEGNFNGSSVRIFGYYADDYVLVGDQWLFKRRKLIPMAPLAGF